MTSRLWPAVETWPVHCGMLKQVCGSFFLWTWNKSRKSEINWYQKLCNSSSPIPHWKSQFLGYWFSFVMKVLWRQWCQMCGMWASTFLCQRDELGGVAHVMFNVTCWQLVWCPWNCTTPISCLFLERCFESWKNTVHEVVKERPTGEKQCLPAQWLAWSQMLSIWWHSVTHLSFEDGTFK